MKRGRKSYKPITVLMDTETPPEIVAIAERRCRDMLHRLNMIDFDLKRLVVSAYLQGVNDYAIVTFQNGFVPPGCTDVSFLGEGI